MNYTITEFQAKPDDKNIPIITKALEKLRAFQNEISAAYLTSWDFHNGYSTKKIYIDLIEKSVPSDGLYQMISEIEADLAREGFQADISFACEDFSGIQLLTF